MYYQAIAQCTQALRNLETWLDKAEQYARARHFDVGVLMTDRLAPDMKPFIYQVQSACDYAKAGAAWLSGQKPPNHKDTEQTIDDLRARIRKTVAFAASVTEAQYAHAAEQRQPLLRAARHRSGRSGLPAANDDPERLFRSCHGLRRAPAQRCRRWQDGLPRAHQLDRGLPPPCPCSPKRPVTLRREEHTRPSNTSNRS